MSHYLKVTDEAAEQLFSIARWYAETSQPLEIAAGWYDGFLDKLECLEQNPHQGLLRTCTMVGGWFNQGNRWFLSA